MAYSWDPETKIMYEELGLKNEIRPTYYTSVHYVIKPNNQMQIRYAVRFK